MSLGIVIKGPEGLVLAAESRLTLTAQRSEAEERLTVSFDNATKLFGFSQPNSTVGVVTYGVAAIQARSAASFVPEFESQLQAERLPVRDFAVRLSEFYIAQWRDVMPEDYSGPSMNFLVAGFDPPDPYGLVYEVKIPEQPNPVELNPGPGNFGITWGGQSDFVDRLLRGYDRQLPMILGEALKLTDEQKAGIQPALERLQMPLPLQAMPLQDCVDLAVFFIRTTIAAQSLTVGIRGVGGPIDVATVTRREGLVFVKQKQIHVD